MINDYFLNETLCKTLQSIEGDNLSLFVYMRSLHCRRTNFQIKAFDMRMLFDLIKEIIIILIKNF